MKVAERPVVIGVLGIVTKGLIMGLEDWEIREQVETIKTTAFLKSARILGRVLVTLGDLLSLKLHWKPSANAGVKNSQKNNNYNNNDVDGWHQTFCKKWKK